MELLDTGALPSMVCHEQRRAGLVVFKSYRSKLCIESDDLDPHQTVLVGKGRVSVVPGVQLSARVRFGAVNKISLFLVSLAVKRRSSPLLHTMTVFQVSRPGSHASRAMPLVSTRTASSQLRIWSANLTSYELKFACLGIRSGALK